MKLLILIAEITNQYTAYLKFTAIGALYDKGIGSS